MADIKLLVSGMTCNHCVMAVKQSLERVPGVTHANVNLNEGTAEVGGEADPQALIDAVVDEGYKARLA